MEFDRGPEAAKREAQRFELQVIAARSEIPVSPGGDKFILTKVAPNGVPHLINVFGTDNPEAIQRSRSE